MVTSFRVALCALLLAGSIPPQTAKAMDQDTQEVLAAVGVVAGVGAGIALIYKFIQWLFAPTDAEVIQHTRAAITLLNSGYSELHAVHRQYAQATAPVQRVLEALSSTVGPHSVLALTDGLGMTVRDLKDHLAEIAKRMTKLEGRLRKKQDQISEQLYHECKELSDRGIQVLVSSERLLHFLRAHREYFILESTADTISSRYALDLSVAASAGGLFEDSMSSIIMNHHDIMVSKYPYVCYAQQIQHEATRFQQEYDQARLTHSYMNLERHYRLLLLLKRINHAVVSSDRYSKETCFKRQEELELQKIALEKEKIELERKKLEQLKKDHELKKAELEIERQKAHVAQTVTPPVTIHIIT